MKYVLLLILAAGLIKDPLKIGKVNRAKTKAREAYTAGNYNVAIETYRYLVDSLEVNEDEIVLNLANAYFLTKDTAQAFTHYQSLTGSEKGEVRSKAQQQLGIMNYRNSKLEEALLNFKQAIKADPLNGQARYNYEMLKRKLEEKKKQDEKNKLPKEPSAFAKKLKERATNMAAQGQFADAYNLMAQGAQQDKSVFYYTDFMNRLKEVADINALKK